MQYIDIEKNGEPLIRIPLGGFDLMEKYENWEADAMERARLVDMLLNQFFNEPLITRMSVKNVKYYLVFESRMNRNVKEEVTY